MKGNTDLHIALAADSNYIVPTTVVLQSLFDCHADAKMHIYLLYLEGTMSEKDLGFLASFTQEHKHDFTPLEVKPEQIEGFPENRYGKAALLRLCLPELLPQLEKILYIDGDTLVQDSLTELYQTDISRHFVAASKDTALLYDPERIEALGIDNASHWYFNAGVTLLNLKMFRSVNLSKEMTSFTRKHYDIITYPDQDFLNYICQGKTLYIHPRYNMNYDVEKDIAWQTWGGVKS